MARSFWVTGKAPFRKFSNINLAIIIDIKIWGVGGGGGRRWIALVCICTIGIN